MGEVEYYLDASFLVALLIGEPLGGRADRFIQAAAAVLIVSDLAAAEYVSAVSRRVRMGQFTREQGQFALATFDGRIADALVWIEISPADIAQAAAFLRRLDLPLRTPDAIHIAIARRLGVPLVTLDRRMIANAKALGVSVAEV